MSEAKGMTEKAPRASQKELEAVLHRIEYETAGLRWALKKFNTRDVLEEFRGVSRYAVPARLLSGAACAPKG